MQYQFKRADALEPGDLIDLEDDPFADPKRDHIAYQFELATVYETERETPNCIAVHLDSGDAVGFPPSHRVVVVTP